MTTENIPAKTKAWQDGVVKELWADKFKQAVAVALPRTVPADHFLRTIITMVRTNPNIVEASAESIQMFVMNAAQLNLSVQPQLGQIYPVPFFNNKTGKKEVQPIIGYRGFITLARRTGQVSSVQADVICQNDKIEYRKGTDPMLSHVPPLTDRGEVLGAYAVITFKDGSSVFDIMGIGEIHKVRAGSKAWQNYEKKGFTCPWVTHPEEMDKKTVLRRLFKLAPLAVEDVEMTKALEIDNQDFIPEAEIADDTPKETTKQKLARAAKSEPEPGSDSPAEKIDPKVGWFMCAAVGREIPPDAITPETCAKCPRPDASSCEHFQ